MIGSKTDERYPYTYAYDYLRREVGLNSDGCTKISRGDASLITGIIAFTMGIDHKEVVIKLADRYLEDTR